MNDSILTSTKKLLGVDESDTIFDTDIITSINTVMPILYKLGLDSAKGFYIEDNSAIWQDLLHGIPELNIVKTYVYQKVRLMFDPPASSIVVEVIKESIKELEWRISDFVDCEFKLADDTNA